MCCVDDLLDPECDWVGLDDPRPDMVADVFDEGTHGMWMLALACGVRSTLSLI